MRTTKVLRCLGAALILLVSLGAGASLAAPLPQTAMWVITYPSDGTVVSGQVVIQGSASHPSFNSYGVLYAAGPTPTGNSQWIPIVFSVPNMVVNGALATWDTTQIPNGQYTLALAVYGGGSTDPNLYFVNYITVQNEPATPTPTPTPTATPEADSGSALEGLISGPAIRDAFMTGVWIAVMLYAIGILYVAGRAALRHFLRQQRRPRQPS